MNVNIFKNTIFGKVFILIFVSISLVLGLFAYQATIIQKDSILNSLEDKAKSMSDSITFVNTEAMIIDDEIKILEFVYDFVQENKDTLGIVVSRKNGNDLVIQNDKWEMLDKPEKNKSKIFIEKSEIIYSEVLKKDIFRYTYPIFFSEVSWGWLYLDLSLDEYYLKIDAMYKQFMYLALIMLITTLVVSFFIAKMISKPIVNLENISKDISNGDLSKRVNIETNDEIGQLAQSFNKMVNNLQHSQEKLQKSHEQLEERVNERTKQLKELNETLEVKVVEEISKQKEQEQILIQQSKLAAMGEMIGNIAHQWRQPLNALGLVMQNIQFSYEMGDLDDEFMEHSTKKVNLLTKTMSKTIDDFRSFFKPNKEKSSFDLGSNVYKSISLVESTLEHHDISLKCDELADIKVYGFENEFSQTVLNILSNAKDALIQNETPSAFVKINIEKDDKYGNVIVEDNAGGIPEDIIDKIFNPYFTTKEEGKGTGIGLYMSKIIIEQNMNGKLEVENLEHGAKFTIRIPLEGMRE